MAMDNIDVYYTAVAHAQPNSNMLTISRKRHDEIIIDDFRRIYRSEWDEYEVHCILINGLYYLHREDGPAYKHANRYRFHHEGMFYSIENMPIEDDMKMILTLTYTKSEIGEDWYYK